MRDFLQRVHDLVAALFMSLSPALFVAFSVGLLAMALWAGQRAWHNHHLAWAVAHAPLVDTRSGASGLVKLRGTAQHAEARAGQGPASLIWYARSEGSGGHRTTMTAGADFLIRDAHGACAIRVIGAEIRPSDYTATAGFLDKSRSSRVEQALYAGDTVFAVGELRRDLPPLAGMPQVPCQLTRAGGVLLVSGEPERSSQVFFRLWSLVQAPLALLSFALLGFGAWFHVVGYPDGPGGPAATFLNSLMTTPWKFAAGPEHPQWVHPPGPEAGTPDQ